MTGLEKCWSAELKIMQSYMTTEVNEKSRSCMIKLCFEMPKATEHTTLTPRVEHTTLTPCVEHTTIIPHVEHTKH